MLSCFLIVFLETNFGPWATVQNSTDLINGQGFHLGPRERLHNLFVFLPRRLHFSSAFLKLLSVFETLRESVCLVLLREKWSRTGGVHGRKQSVKHGVSFRGLSETRCESRYSEMSLANPENWFDALNASQLPQMCQSTLNSTLQVIFPHGRRV